MGHPTIDQETERLRTIVKESKTVDPIDLAIIEALGSQEVSALLGPILDEGAVLTGATLSPAGSMEGIAMVTFNTKWLESASRLSLPQAVSVLLELAPPKVLRVEKHPAENAALAAPFSFPSGPTPVAIRGMAPPNPTQLLAFLRESNRSTEDWLSTANLSGGGGLLGGGGTLAGGGLFGGTITAVGTTGTKCTSFFCFEKTSDDNDRD